MSKLLNIVGRVLFAVVCVVLFVVAAPFEVALRAFGYQCPEEWSHKSADAETGSASVAFVMFMAFMVLVGLVLVFAMQSGAFVGGTGSVAPACFTPGGIQVVCG
jgi:FtsH-binding integral membrane protein